MDAALAWRNQAFDAELQQRMNAILANMVHPSVLKVADWRSAQNLRLARNDYIGTIAYNGLAYSGLSASTMLSSVPRPPELPCAGAVPLGT
jgi:hypothetical protein